MIIFDQLRLSDDGKAMYINAHVNEATEFSNVYIKSVTIMTAEKVSETRPYQPSEDSIYYSEYESGTTKQVDLVLSASDFTKSWETDPSKMTFKESEMRTTLFFVYIQAEGAPDPSVPCTIDREYTVGVLFYDLLLYQRVMYFTKSLQDDCKIPVGFTDFILLWNAFKAAVKTEHYLEAIKYYNMLFSLRGQKDQLINKGCSCHG